MLPKNKILKLEHLVKRLNLIISIRHFEKKNAYFGEMTFEPTTAKILFSNFE